MQDALGPGLARMRTLNNDTNIKTQKLSQPFRFTLSGIGYTNGHRIPKLSSALWKYLDY